MPGTMLLECMVQLAATIMREASDFEHLGILAQVSRLRLRRIVTPGDQVELEVKLKSADGDSHQFEGQCRVTGSVCASAEFAMMRRPLEDFESRAEARKAFQMLQPRRLFDME